MPVKYLTAAQAKARLKHKGLSATALARELGVHPNTVHEVLSGRRKGTFGDAHRVAVAVGMKPGEIVPKDQSIVDALRPSDPHRHAA